MAELATAVDALRVSKEGLVVVLDLDATVWLPEVYTLRAPRDADDTWTPMLGKDVRVLPGAAAVLKLLAARPDTRVAVASRSGKPAWSNALLAEVPNLGDKAIEAEVYPGDKRTHLRRIAKSLGCAFSSMLLFDDARDGKHGNCVNAAELGCLAVHCPQGLDEERWRAGLAAFEGGVRGKVVDAPGASAWTAVGAKCGKQGVRGGPPAATVTLPAVSLAMPFAALLLNGFKTLETRTNELFAPLEGKRVVIRIGMKDWDNSEWTRWHPAGAADLPRGFRRGDVAGVVTVGATRKLVSFEDAAPRACFEAPAGAFGTVVEHARWFPRPWRVKGFPGVVDLDVPADLVAGPAAAPTGPPAIGAAVAPAAAAPAAAPAAKQGNRRQRRARGEKPARAGRPQLHY